MEWTTRDGPHHVYVWRMHTSHFIVQSLFSLVLRREPSACCERLANLLRWCRVALMGRDLAAWSLHHSEVCHDSCDIVCITKCVSRSLCLLMSFLSFRFCRSAPTESRVATGSFGPLNANHGIVQVEKKPAAWRNMTNGLRMDMHCDALHCYWCNCVLTLYRHTWILSVHWSQFRISDEKPVDNELTWQYHDAFAIRSVIPKYDMLESKKISSWAFKLCRPRLFI